MDRPNALPTVSVIIPTFNRAHYLGECLESMLAQTHPARQIIVVDDGSTDGTADVVARFGARVQYLRKDNGGKPSAVNLGLKEADGDLIWLFDDDDVALPDAIEQRLTTLADNPAADFVYSSHYRGKDGPDRRIERGRLYEPTAPSHEKFFVEITCGCFFHLNSALVRREHWLALGGLDPLLLSGEDYDFQIRLAAIAIPAFCPSPSFIFRQHDGARGALAVRHTAADRGLVFKRYSQSVGRKLRASYELSDYLVPRTHGVLSVPQRRSALLNRIHAMANHGCISELLDDMRLFLEAATPETKPSSEELNQLSVAITRGWAYAVISEEWRPFLKGCRTLSKYRHGTSCTRAISLGLLRLAKGHPSNARIKLEQVARAVHLLFISAT